MGGRVETFIVTFTYCTIAMWAARSQAVSWVRAKAIGVIDDLLTLLPEPQGLLVDEGAQTDLSGRVRGELKGALLDEGCGIGVKRRLVNLSVRLYACRSMYVC